MEGSVAIREPLLSPSSVPRTRLQASHLVLPSMETNLRSQPCPPQRSQSQRARRRSVNPKPPSNPREPQAPTFPAGLILLITHHLHKLNGPQLLALGPGLLLSLNCINKAKPQGREGVTTRCQRLFEHMEEIRGEKALVKSGTFLGRPSKENNISTVPTHETEALESRQ